ncbi:hypothetical protein [Umezawaea sp. NPDC059074]|uniref:hypothetical protein n=1 Tax=Umezawaea sp. NPDC059074 TaxID=3346716 RepID=UPI00368A12E0
MIPWRRALPAAFLLLAVTACSSGTPTGTTAEDNPVGDIPDNQAFVPFTPTGGLFTVSVPEGWSRSGDGADVTFTDKLTSIHVEQRAAASAPTVASVRDTVLPGLRSSAKGFQEDTVKAATRKAGDVVVLTYHADSAPDPVTGKSVAQDLERYEYFHSGQSVVLTFAAPKGSDNVDPWRTVTDSLSWSK